MSDAPDTDEAISFTVEFLRYKSGKDNATEFTISVPEVCRVEASQLEDLFHERPIGFMVYVPNQKGDVKARKVD